jgi:ABC-2 type transport system ATP-binding protein
LFVATTSLTKQYGDFLALDDCSFTVARGEVFGLLGPNGAGKTTLLRLLMGFLKPTRGTARIDGLDCTHDSVRVHQRVAYLPGDVQLFRSMRGRDVLRFFAEVRPDGDVQRSLALAERLELDLSRQVGFMSTGMRQKLALVATLAANTPLVILDEPTANLDPSVRAEIVKLVLEAKQAGRTVMFSSHVLSEVEEACDRVMILRQGRVVHEQPMSELRLRHRITAQVVGSFSPPAHLADQVALQHADDGTVTIETANELSPLLGWLSSLPLREVKIEPVGLRAVYEQFHSGVKS